MSTTTPAADAPAARLPRPVVRALTALVCGGLAAILDGTIVTIALDRLGTAMDASTVAVQWVTTAYLLAVAVAVPLSGWVQGRFGGKRAWMGALVVFVLGSAGCAMAWGIGSLIALRVLQGFGAGLILPLMQTLAMQAVGRADHRLMTKTIAAVSVPIALGPVIGPVVGGVVLHWLGWRWIFLINVPLIGIGLLLAHRFLATDRPRPGGSENRLDLVGFALLAPALAGILLGLSDVVTDGGVRHTDVWAPAAVGLVLLVIFVARTVRRGDRGLIDLTVLRLRSLSVSSLVLFSAGAVLYAGMFLLPLYFQQVRGETVLVAALLLIPQGVGALASRVVVTSLVTRFGPRAVTAGAIVVAMLGTVPFACAGPQTSIWWLAAVLIVRGFGVGAVLIPPMMTAYRDVARERMPHATMTTRVTQQIGASCGMAVIASVLQSLSTNGALAGFRGAFWWAVAITGVALLPTMALGREKLEG